MSKYFLNGRGISKYFSYCNKHNWYILLKDSVVLIKMKLNISIYFFFVPSLGNKAAQTCWKRRLLYANKMSHGEKGTRQLQGLEIAVRKTRQSQFQAWALGERRVKVDRVSSSQWFNQPCLPREIPMHDNGSGDLLSQRKQQAAERKRPGNYAGFSDFYTPSTDCLFLF